MINLKLIMISLLNLSLGYFCFVFDKQATDFLDKLLRYDHQDRLTAREAMVFFIILCELPLFIS